MTASVSTRGMKGALYSDAQRELMYADALTYYIHNLLPQGGYKIVFVENSGWNLDSLKNKLPSYNPSEIEFVSLAPEDFDITRGKGYNEVLMINQAVSKSKFINSAEGFFKVTGRYPIYNIKHFIDNASQFIHRGGGICMQILRTTLYMTGYGSDGAAIPLNVAFSA